MNGTDLEWNLLLQGGEEKFVCYNFSQAFQGLSLTCVVPLNLSFDMAFAHINIQSENKDQSINKLKKKLEALKVSKENATTQTTTQTLQPMNKSSKEAQTQKEVIVSSSSSNQDIDSFKDPKSLSPIFFKILPPVFLRRSMPELAKIQWCEDDTLQPGIEE